MKKLKLDNGWVSVEIEGRQVVLLVGGGSNHSWASATLNPDYARKLAAMLAAEAAKAEKEKK